ncbi:hypothetical protein JY651_14590 [Pyxidicoccus parkwayensis]|uniref:DUF1963 domain-containing protein n=1 Tax=Pyxidicoccus parkwayensis TaxID=2813578 RepID=A0ABX7P6J4_9BACT|nr:hypothetical protein [Pyxidicoccus parkwaysis]QSQ26073.1 hypothetical protein JY651_14590 [Pyxidicoccus parkwaysis]
MKNLRVTFIALGVWLAVSTALVTLLPLEQAMPYLLLGLLLPAGVFAVERFRSEARTPPPPVAAPITPAPPEDLTEENLRRAFGDDSVAPAWRPKHEVSPAPVDALERLGGSPAFLAPVEYWPRCRHCKLQLTFIMQVAVGPERPLRYPQEGTLYVFLCQRVDPDVLDGAICPCHDVDLGAECCFVQTRPAGFLGLAVDTNHPRLAESYAVESWESRPSVRMPPGVATPEQYRLNAGIAGGFTIQVGGFADWMQDDATPGPCSCGAPRELLLQFSEFTADLNLGGAGRAYVYACSARHAPEAFSLFWQTS